MFKIREPERMGNCTFALDCMVGCCCAVKKFKNYKNNKEVLTGVALILVYLYRKNHNRDE